MARHGENIRKRIDGRWEGRYKVFCKEKSKTVYRSLYGRSYDEVKEKLAILKNPMQNSVLDGLLFSEAAEEWLEGIIKIRKCSTYVKYDAIYRKHLAPLLGKYPVEQLNESLIPKKIFDHLSESQQKSIYCVINQVISYVNSKYHSTIPRLKRKTTKINKKQIEILSKDEQSDLFACLYHKTDRYKTAVLLCLYTGLRLGEVCALKWSDINYKDMTISVHNTVQRIAVKGMQTKTILLETEPKSDSSKREIPVSAATLQLLIKLRDNQPYIFGGAKSLEPRTMQYQFRKILKEAGMTGKSFHILRHTFATNCVEGGVDVKSLSEILGHSDVKITLNRYVHPTMDLKRKQMERLRLFYGQICGQAV